MKMFVRSFIYLAIIVIIAELNNAGTAHAKSLTEMNNLLMEPSENLSEFESPVARMRRNVDPKATIEGDKLKEEPNTGFRLRTRRQASSGESDIPKEYQKVAQLIRAKRQIPSPPGEMPMPPM